MAWINIIERNFIIGFVSIPNMRILARTGPALLSEPLGSTSSQTKLSLLITMDLFAFKRLSEQTKALLRQEEKKYKQVSLPYFGVKLSCVCIMFAYRKKVMTCPCITIA